MGFKGPLINAGEGDAGHRSKIVVDEREARMVGAMELCRLTICFFSSLARTHAHLQVFHRVSTVSTTEGAI